jgi:hypothetical protein
LKKKILFFYFLFDFILFWIFIFLAIDDEAGVTWGGFLLFCFFFNIFIYSFDNYCFSSMVFDCYRSLIYFFILFFKFFKFFLPRFINFLFFLYYSRILLFNFLLLLHIFNLYYNSRPSPSGSLSDNKSYWLISYYLFSLYTILYNYSFNVYILYPNFYFTIYFYSDDVEKKIYKLFTILIAIW